MNQAQKYLAQANRHIAELAVQIAHQRVIVRHALTQARAQGWRRRYWMRSKQAFASSRSTGYFCSGCSVQVPRPAGRGHDGPRLAMTTPGQRMRHDRLTNAALAASFGTRREEKESPGAVRPGLSPNEKMSRGFLDAPILFQSMRRAIIRKRETRNTVNEGLWLPQTTYADCAVRSSGDFSCRRRHQPRRPPLAKIRPGRPAPAMGPGTGAAGVVT